MDEMVAFCGLICSKCPAYIATLENDDDARRRIAEQWSKEFNSDIKPEDVNCVGCTVMEGRHIGHCAICEIRKCGIERGVVNCAHCADYACETLEGFLEKVPAAREKLDGIHRELA
jgi:hypothetical protein